MATEITSVTTTQTRDGLRTRFRFTTPCFWCKKPITGRVYTDNGHDSHKKCIVKPA